MNYWDKETREPIYFSIGCETTSKRFIERIEGLMRNYRYFVIGEDFTGVGDYPKCEFYDDSTDTICTNSRMSDEKKQEII